MVSKVKVKVKERQEEKEVGDPAAHLANEGFERALAEVREWEPDRFVGATGEHRCPLLITVPESARSVTLARMRLTGRVQANACIYRLRTGINGVNPAFAL